MTDSLTDNPLVSAVIPTRNRAASLHRLLRSLAAQTHLPAETIIVDASDTPHDGNTLRGRFPSLHIRLITSAPSLCRQRNTGIARASGDFIFLADDDLEFEPTYLAVILEHYREHPAEGAVSGTQRESVGGRSEYPDRIPLRASGLLWSFLFQTSVWGNIDALRGNWLLRPVLRHYERRGNTFSLAGWPLLTAADPPSFHTAIYGLGGAVIRREWLLAAPYDERLDASGIGDNYGVALQFPGPLPIVVLTTVSYVHHRSPEHRVSAVRAYALRVLALDHFMSFSPRFGILNRIFLLWSLIGNAIGFIVTGSPGTAAAAVAVFSRLLFGLNPYSRYPAPPTNG